MIPTTEELERWATSDNLMLSAASTEALHLRRVVEDIAAIAAAAGYVTLRADTSASTDVSGSTPTQGVQQ